jgi:hypothetical protein
MLIMLYTLQYNAINGVPACMDSFLAQTTARQHWKFDGFIESDCDSVGDLETNFHLANNSAEASALAINAGCDLDCGKTFLGNKHEKAADKGLAGAIAKNLTTEQALRASFKRAMTPVFEAGQFDAVNSTPFTALRAADAAGHPGMAKDAAAQSLVLLKNENATLPLAADGQYKSVALLGPLATARAELVGPVTIGPCAGSSHAETASGTPLSLPNGRLGGGYKGDYSCIPNLNESLHAWSGAVAPGSGKIVVECGTQACSLTDKSTSKIAAAVAAAKAADAVVLAVGAGLTVVDEGADLDSIALPGAQVQLVQEVAAALRDTPGKPLVVLVIGANALALDAWIEQVPAALNCFIPSGNWAADVILDALFNRAGNRFGKLPYTHYVAAYTKAVPLEDMSFSAGPGRSYRYLRDSKKWSTFQFGWGLSYTKFALELEQPSSSASSKGLCGSATDSVTFSVHVSNIGGLDGDEVVQVYSVPSPVLANGSYAALGGAPVPNKNLVEFARVRVMAGETVTVAFAVPCSMLSFVDAAGRRMLWPVQGGFLEVSNGGVSESARVPVQMAFDSPIVLDQIQPGSGTW